MKKQTQRQRISITEKHMDRTGSWTDVTVNNMARGILKICFTW
jgi:nicotinamide mononucleotide (NMN) deamidase PncC